MNPYSTVNPFLNPIYGNYGQANYAQPIPQIQQNQSVGIPGKYVNDFNEITASDIPMNAPVVFAKNDRSEIQIREWNANGQIVTTSYKAVIEPTKPVTTLETDELLKPIIAKLTDLEEKIDKLQKPTITKIKKENE